MTEQLSKEEITTGCILDAGSLGPGVDLSPIVATLKNWTVYDTTSPAQVGDRIRHSQVVLSNKVMLNRSELQRAARLRYISVLATGTNNVDLAAARELGIHVSNVRNYSTDSVVQHTVSVMLALAGNLRSYCADVEQQRWQKGPFFCYFNRPIVELAGKLLTIVGAGQQGNKLAALAATLGMKVQFARRPGSDADPRPPLAELLAHTDVLSFHCPLTPATAGLVNLDNIFTMKPDALVINCARGGLIDESALATALNRGHLGGAAVDVSTVEPPPADHPLLHVNHPNFILTPHIAWASSAARNRLIAETAANVGAFLAGERRFAVD